MPVAAIFPVSVHTPAPQEDSIRQSILLEQAGASSTVLGETTGVQSFAHGQAASIAPVRPSSLKAEMPETSLRAVIITASSFRKYS